MKVTYISNKTPSISINSDYLMKGIQAILDGIHALVTSPSTALLSSTKVSFTATVSLTHILEGYDRACEEFSQAENYFAAMAMSSIEGLYFDGNALGFFLADVKDEEDRPYKFAFRVYGHPNANQADYDSAYEMYQTYVTSINHLRDLLKEVVDKEVTVKWQLGTEPVNLDKLIPAAPKALSRKIYKKPSD